MKWKEKLSVEGAMAPSNKPYQMTDTTISAVEGLNNSIL